MTVMAIKEKSKTPTIIDSELYQALLEENQALREKLAEVSSVGISAMFHTHRSDAENYSRAVLKGAAELMKSIRVEDLNDIYEQGYELAAAPSVLERFSYPNLK